jgi:hypothetical protein
MTKKPTQKEMAELLFAALAEGCEPNFNIILNSLNGAFHCRYKPQPELVPLMQANQERFIALLDTPVIITVDWGFGATFATVTVVPAGKKPDNKPFERFTLPIPADKPYAVLQ